jgi:hypothetical protein
MALAFESVYGTPPASGAYWRMPFANSTRGAEQPLLASELLGYGRDPITPVKDAITVDGDVTVPIDARFLGVWLKALFGDPTTTDSGGAAPYTHTFVSGGWTLPSMAIEVGMPDVPHFAMVSGVVANQLSWQMQRSGLVTAAVGLIAQGESVGSASSAGTLNAMDLLRFGAFSGSVSREGAQLGNIVSAQVTYSNNLDRIETIRDDGRIDGADPAMAALSGSIDVRFADQVLLNQAIAGAPCELEFAYTVGVDTAFTLTAHAVYLPRPRLPLQGPGGVQASFAWQAALDSVAGQMCTATLVNDQADYTNPGS